MGQGESSRVRRWFVPAVTVLLVAAVPLVGQQPAEDPVDALVQVLKSGPPDVKERRKALEEKARGLKDIGQLRKALALSEWQDEFRAEGGGAANPVRQEIGQRLEQKLRAILKTGDDQDKVAVITLIGELGTSVQDTDPEARGGFARRFTEDLVRFSEPGNDRRIQVAAARALGKVLPDPELANPTFDKLLQGGDKELRRIAAAALLEQLRNAYGRRRRGEIPTTGVTLPREDMVPLGLAVASVAGRFANDPDPVVQTNCLEALQYISEAISDYYSSIPNPAVRARIETVAQQLAEQLPTIVASLQSQNCPNRRLTARVLESFGLTMRILSAPINPVGAPLPKQKGGILPPGLGAGDPIRKGLIRMLPGMATAMGDPDSWVRVYLMNAIDAVGPDAAPIVSTLALTARDPNVYVRWTTARIIGKFAPAAPEGGVPTLARLVLDPDLDVRRSALDALLEYGEKLAGPAFPALARASSTGDTDVRLVAIRVLRDLRVPAGIALPALLANLRESDARVRRDSIEAIGRLGTAANSALPTLRCVLTDDPDTDVRKAASEAVLLIGSGV